MAIAQRLLAAGRTVELIDDHASPGGGLRALRLDGHHGFARIASSFDALVARDRVRVHTNAVAGGLYERDLLVVTEAGAEILRAETLVLACGAHDGVCAFEGNDLPGIMSARAAGFLLERGILAGLRPVVVVPPTGGPFGASYIDAFTRRTNASAHADASIELVSGEPVRASGNGRVSSVIVRTTSGEREFVTDAVLVDAPRAPAHELATQAGANLVHEPRGYVVVTDSGRIRPGLYAVGELTGVALDSAAIEADAERVAETIAADRS